MNPDLFEREVLKPDKGNGSRWLNCPRYDLCLGYAARENWKGFNCGKCDLRQKGLLEEMGKIDKGKEDAVNEREQRKKDKEEAIVICSECGKWPAKKNGICGYCNKKRNDEIKREQEDEREDKEKTERAGNGNLVELDLSTYPEVMEALEKSAHIQIRSIEHQIIFYITKGLKDDGFEE